MAQTIKIQIHIELNCWIHNYIWEQSRSTAQCSLLYLFLIRSSLLSTSHRVQLTVEYFHQLLILWFQQLTVNYLSQFLLTWLLLPVVKHSAPGRNLASTRLTLLTVCNWNRMLIARRITPLIKGTVWNRILVPRRIKAVKGQCGTGYSPLGK